MRIQHNIVAMSSYRNYINNTKSVSKNLERLSSGYKINRAGDDAAGLAISEKMRAQITGLDAASKNAKDGISLVKTAEGALQEVHDMLNRMVNLATQSANGTYDDKTDRAQLQKEVDQLRDEINRIADSANFNGIKLLDGSLNEESTTIAGTALINLNNETNAGQFINYDTTNVTTGTSTATSMSTVLHKDAGANDRPTTFEVNLDGLEIKDIADTTKGASVCVTVGGVALTMASVSTKTDSAGIATALAATQNGKELSFNGVSYSVKADGSKLVFTMTDAAKVASTIAASFTGNFAVTVGLGDSANGKATLTNNSNILNHTSNVQEGSPAAGEVLAKATQGTAFTHSDIKDGLTLQVGNEAYIFALTNDGFEKATAVANTVQPNGVTYKVVDVRDLTNPTTNGSSTVLAGTTDAEKTIATSNALTRLTEVAKDNEMFSVGLAPDDSLKLSFQEKSTYDGDARLDKLNSTGDASLKGKTLVDQFKLYKNVTFDVKNASVTVQGKALTLQIGDTADAFNQLKVNVKDCHTSSLGIADLNIANQEGAKAAIDKIRSAINTVSDIRGTLGATQNRLDHTINNLSVMKENIQDAESTIRDTDIAEEMMAYTKNNILVQSAQAMLAQANQIPQGVLQLLG